MLLSFPPISFKRQGFCSNIAALPAWEPLEGRGYVATLNSSHSMPPETAGVMYPYCYLTIMETTRSWGLCSHIVFFPSYSPEIEGDM